MKGDKAPSCFFLCDLGWKWRTPFLAEVRALAQAFGKRRVRWSSPLHPARGAG